MKALIRDNEIYRESEWSPFTWNHIEWYATEAPHGNNYALCGDCPDEALPEEFTIERHEKVIDEENGTTVAVLVAIYNGD